MPPLTVVIVNFNGGQAIQACLSALEAQTMDHDVLVIDNASTDDSARALNDRFPRTRILPLRRNVGFARAVNIATERIQHDGVLALLNPDTIPSPSYLHALVQPLEDDLRIGATSGTLVFASNPSVVASAGIVVHRNGVALDDRLGENYDRDQRTLRQVFGVSGGAAAYRLSAFRAAGGLCEPFFLYLEDVDLAWRLRLRGWESVNVNAAVATHAYSASAVEGSAFKRRLLARNRIWTLARCLPRDIWIRDRASILAFDLLAAGHGTITRDGALLQGRAAALAGMPARLRERRWIQRYTTIEHQELANWIQPAVSPATLLNLRRLTARLAQPPSR